MRVVPLLACLCLSACQSERTPQAVRPDGPQRIVTLGPAPTEIVWALGMGERLVGRSRWDRTPPAVLQVPDLGDAIRPSVEAIVAARPDLVVLYPAGDNAPAIAALTRAGIATLALRVDRIDDFLHAVDTLGTLLGVRPRADSMVRAMRAELDAVRAEHASDSRPTLFIPVWSRPLMTVGATSFLSELVEIAGGRNLYADRAEPSFTVALEDVVRRAPDAVLASPGRVTASPPQGWQALRAARDGRIVPLDTVLMSQPSIRLGEAARALAQSIAALPR